MPAKRKRTARKHHNAQKVNRITGTPFNKKSVPVGDRFRKGAVSLLRPDLKDPTHLTGKNLEDYALHGINILRAMNARYPPQHRYPLKKPIFWTVATSVIAIVVVVTCNAAGSRYVGDLPVPHRFRPFFCQFLAAQAFLGFDTGQYAIIARCTQVSPINISV